MNLYLFLSIKKEKTWKLTEAYSIQKNSAGHESKIYSGKQLYFQYSI